MWWGMILEMRLVIKLVSPLILKLFLFPPLEAKNYHAPYPFINLFNLFSINTH